MKFSFDQRIARAEKLSREFPAAREILEFYGKLANFQKCVFEDVAREDVSSVETLARYAPEFARLIGRIAPPALAESAVRWEDEAVGRDLLRGVWQEPSIAVDDHARFFARALLQPFAEYVAGRAQFEVESMQPICPFCSSAPVVAVLRGEGDGAKRSLLCSLCSTEWPYRRILCPNCGEEDKAKLPIYRAAEFDHVRAESCDRCRVYLKAVDLTKNGHAVPVVDEIATLPLNIWAEEQGYVKLTPNLVLM